MTLMRTKMGRSASRSSMGMQKHNPHCVDVACKRVLSFHVPVQVIVAWSVPHGALVVSSFFRAGEPKVRHSSTTILPEENVLCLDVTVEERALMQTCHPQSTINGRTEAGRPVEGEGFQ